jgi:large-conductance mechanosensitive channel
MADVVSQVQGMLPSLSGVKSFFSSALGIGAILILSILVIGLLGVGLYFILKYLKFNRTIVIFDKINGRWEVAGKDKAMEVRYNTMGDVVFYLRKRKKYLPRPDRQAGRRTYWFAIDGAGHWNNIGIEDIDFKKDEMQVNMQVAMDYARTSLQRGVKQHYDKQTFMEKHGALVISVIFFTIIGIIFYLMIDKIVSVGSQLKVMADTGVQVMEKAQQVLAGLNNICSNSGARPA